MDPTAAAAYELVQDALLTPHSRINLVLSSLPVLQKEGLDLDEQCPICLMPFAAIFAEQVDALGGLTKLGCGHIFCRRDLTEWIRSLHGNCPTCRHTFLDIRPHSDSDDESSDGGEYIPNPDELEDEDEDAFLDSVDLSTEADTDVEDFPVQGMDLDLDGIWAAEEMSPYVDGDLGMETQNISESDGEGDGSSEWGLTDGESASMSSSNDDFSVEIVDGQADHVEAELGSESTISVQEVEADVDAAQERLFVSHDTDSDDRNRK